MVTGTDIWKVVRAAILGMIAGYVAVVALESYCGQQEQDEFIIDDEIELLEQQYIDSIEIELLSLPYGTKVN